MDWIRRQYDPGADWPHIESLADYRRRFGWPEPACKRCGGSHRLAICPGFFRSFEEAAAHALANPARRWGRAPSDALMRSIAAKQDGARLMELRRRERSTGEG